MNQISLLQGILLALMAFIVGIDFWIEGLFIFRPIIVSTLTGLILGDVRIGLVTGGLTELAFAGLTPAGGTQPPNPVMAGIMATVLAYTTGKNENEVIGLALPFSFLMQYILLFYYSIFSFFNVKLEKAADNADGQSFRKYAIIPMIIVAITYALVVFLSTYLAQDLMRNLVNSLPEWLTHGLEVAGGVLPAVGFAMLLNIMFKLEYLPYLVIGFILATFIEFPNLLPIALIGASFALITYFREKNNANANKEVFLTDEKEDYSNGI